MLDAQAWLMCMRRCSQAKLQLEKELQAAQAKTQQLKDESREAQAAAQVSHPADHLTPVLLPFATSTL